MNEILSKTTENDIYKKSRLFYIIEAAVEYFLATFVASKI